MFNRSIDDSALPDSVGGRLVDGYLQLASSQAWSYRKRPGLRLFCDLHSGAPVDAIYWWDAKSVGLAVSGGSLYKLSSSDGNCAKVDGDALSVVGHTTFADNGSYVIMASGGRMISYDNTNPPAFIADADAPTAVTHVAFLDRYILANQANGSRFNWSDVNAPLNWTSTSFASPESKADTLLALHVGWREITLFGRQSVEVWYNDGTTPFSRLEGAYLERGCIAANSIVNAGGVWMWLDDERRVTMLEGRTPKLISGPYDDVIRGVSAVSDAYAQFISIGGHAYYLLTLPSVSLTVVYDLTTGAWYEWRYWDSEAGAYKEWLGRCSTYAIRWQKHLVGSRVDGKIYQLQAGTFTDAGTPIRTSFLSGQITHGSLAYKNSQELILRCKRGAGGGNGEEPVFEVRWRDQSGPWSNHRQVSLGKIGERDSVRSLFRLGRYRMRQWEIVHSDNTDFVLSGLEENLEAGE